MKPSRLRRIWYGMRSRCNSNHPRYGGRGIKVCKLWQESFESFESWAMKNGYADHLSIDRKNNDGDYKPSNCRWATAKQQANNHSIPAGMMMVKNVASQIGLRRGDIYAVVKCGFLTEYRPGKRYYFFADEVAELKRQIRIGASRDLILARMIDYRARMGRK